MPHTALKSLRVSLATGAIVALGLTGLSTPAAQADEVPADPPVVAPCDQEADAAALDAAVAEAKAARLAFKASNRPLGQLLKEARTQARADAAAARATIKELRKAGLSKDERAEAKAAAKELRNALKLLDSKKALLTEVKAERRAAKAAWDMEKAEVREIRVHIAGCDYPEEPVTEEPAA